MPANIRMAPTGWMPKVSGRRIEMVASGPMPGQHADHVADQHAEEAPHQIVRLERDAKAVPEICESLRDHESLQANTGIGTCNT